MRTLVAMKYEPMPTGSEVEIAHFTIGISVVNVDTETYERLGQVVDTLHVAGWDTQSSFLERLVEQLRADWSEA